MEGMDKYESHPARDMAIRSMTAVENGQREEWLALWADDGIIEDPVGPSPFDPSGDGHRGIEAIAAFWDNVTSRQPVRFSCRESFAAGNECANVGTITIELDGGMRAFVDGVFVYRINDAGRLVSLRAFWEQEGMRFGESD